MYNFNIVLKALDLYSIHKSKRKVSKILGISRSTIIKWVNKYSNNLVGLTKIINKTYKPIKKKIYLPKKIGNYIIELYNINPFYTRVEILTLIKKKFNVKYGLKKLRKIISKLNLTYKKAKYMVVKNRDYINELELKRKTFNEDVKKLDKDKIICIDESGFSSIYGTYKKGHSIKGKHLLIPINEKKFKNQSLLMAITSETIIEYSVQTDKINSIIFNDFIQNIIIKHKIKGNTFVLG